MEPKCPEAKKEYLEQIPKHEYQSDRRNLVLAATTALLLICGSLQEAPPNSGWSIALYSISCYTIYDASCSLNCSRFI